MDDKTMRTLARDMGKTIVWAYLRLDFTQRQEAWKLISEDQLVVLGTTMIDLIDLLDQARIFKK